MQSPAELLAVIAVAEPLKPAAAPPSKPFNEAIAEMWPILAAVLGLALLLLIWARFFRKTRHEGAGGYADAESGWVKSRRRIRRSEHPYRPRNPTLAETGGLPPLRTEPPPAQPPESTPPNAT